MQSPLPIEVRLTHPGTGRLASVVRVRDLESHSPLGAGGEKYALVVASEREGNHLSVKAARSWVDTGACYVCAWGPSSREIEDSFDYSSFLPELGEPLPFTLMTTSHHRDIEEALWFAFYNGKAPEEPEDGACPVIVVVDSEALEAKAIAWVQGKTE